MALGVLCALILLAALYIAAPWGNTPFYDDFSYCWMAKLLANSGRLVFNGWSEPMVGVQALWGAAIIRVFGFSFQNLRVSMFAWGMACALLMYATGRVVGLRQRFACFGSLALCLCPIMLPLESSFMTDVPSVFFTLAVAYSTARFVRTSSGKCGAAWLMVSLAACVLGYSVRQSDILLIVPIAILTLIWRPGFRLRIFAACCVALAATVCVALENWMATQPNTHSAHLVGSIKASFRHPGDTSQRIAMFALTLALACLPASVLLIRWSKGSVRWWGAGIAFAATVLLVERLRWNTWTLAPGTGIISDRGVRNGFELLGERPVVISTGAIVAFTVLALISLVFVFRVVWNLRTIARGFPISGSWFLAQLMFCGLYLAAVTVRSAGGSPFDRYLVPVLPCLLLGLLALISADRSDTSQTIGWPGWLLLVGFAIFGVLGTHDFYAERMAVTQLADDLVRSGVPRTALTAGPEYDAITQLQLTGTVTQEYVNTKGGPIFACVPYENRIPAWNWFLPCAPTIQPKFVVAAGRLPAEFVPTAHPLKLVRLWLPPFQIDVYAASVPSHYREKTSLDANR
jgi:hypothetical protein